MTFLRITSTRGFQIAFLMILVVCAAQMTWWIVDEVHYTSRVRDAERQNFELHQRVAEECRRGGISTARILDWFPALELEGNAFVVRASAVEQLDRARFRRLNRYGWEGAFFLLVLGLGMIVLSRTLHQYTVLRQHQENFLAAVGHELKSPLASIRLATETMALRDPAPAERQRLVGRLLEDVNRLEDMIQNILVARHLEEGPRASGRCPVDLKEAVQRMLAEERPKLDAQGIQLREHLDGQRCIVADPAGVTSVVRNLLDNAVKAVAQSETRKIDVTVEGRGDRVALVVSDTGYGFPSEEAPRLFGKFVRLGSELRRRSPGVGLGLYLVKTFVEADGGSVAAESAGPGKGARFTVLWRAGE